MISKIKLANFKNFKSKEFEVGYLTFISGINSIGKSAVNQSLLLLKQSYEIGYLQRQRSQVDLSNDFVNLESAEDLYYALDTNGGKKVKITIETDTDNSYAWTIDATNPKAKILDCSYEGVSDWESLSLFQKDFIFLDAERWGPRESYYKKEKRAYNTKLGIQGELTPAYIMNALSENEQIGVDALRHPSLSSFDFYENLNAWISDILSLPIRARVTELEESRVKLSYNFEGSLGKSYSALQVGFGVTFSLPVIVACLRAKRGDLIVIENPEAHLHPSAQVKIGSLLSKLAANGVQVIIESHSDHILNSVRYSFREGVLSDDLVKIIFVRSIETGEGNLPLVDYVRLLENGKLSHRPSDFFDMWDKMLTKLL